MKRVLFIDDEDDLLQRLKEDFKSNNIDVITCVDLDGASAAIENNIPFDVVILDWTLGDSEDGIVSQLFLKRLKNKHFRPVFVYTNDIQNYNETDPSQIDFPQNLLKGLSKDSGFDILKQEIQKMLDQNLSLQISSAYREKIASNFEKVLFELNSLPNADVAMVLKKVIGTGENIDWSNDLILNLIHRSLLADDLFIDNLKKILNAAVCIDLGINETDRKKIANKILYFSPKTNFIRNGDIVRIKKSDDGAIISYGIIVTPDCDLAQENTRYIELVELRLLSDRILALNQSQIDKIKEFNHPSLYYFPSVLVNNDLKDFVSILKSKIIIEEQVEENIKIYPKPSKRLQYTHTFKLNAGVVRMEYICSLSTPYKTEYFHKLQSCNTRVGIPDIKDLWGANN